MPTPCSRCKRQGERCLVDVKSGRCKQCNDSHKKCDLRVTFQEFEKLARARQKQAADMERAEEELEDAEKKAQGMIESAHRLVAEARSKARLQRKLFRSKEVSENEAYQRELASIEELQRMQEEVSAGSSSTANQSLDELLASGDLLDLPEFDFGPDVLQADPAAWAQVTGTQFVGG